MPKKILTWHVHGNYLYYLTQVPHQWYLPAGSKTSQFSWGKNVHEVKTADIPNLDLDAVIFQSRHNYEVDQYAYLTPKQRNLPHYYLEHEPPREHPTDTPHFVNDARTTIVHVTHFNQLMWNNRQQPTVVIEHGVKLPALPPYQGDWERGVVVINNLNSRGRRLGLDIFQQVRQEVPLDLIGMNSQELGGLGEVTYKALPQILTRYRFVFSPIRYTSLGLSLVEAMLLGVPIVGLATTELADVIQHGVHGYISTDVSVLIHHMQYLLNHPIEAHLLSERVKYAAASRFNIDRFIQDWLNVLDQPQVVSTHQSSAAALNASQVSGY